MNRAHARWCFFLALGCTISTTLSARYLYQDPHWAGMLHMFPVCWILGYCFIPESKS